MKGFCLRQMRKEYKGMLRTCTGMAVMLLLIFALLGAFCIINHVEMKNVLFLLGMNLFIVLIFLGAYLIFSDQKWLLKKTPFGRALQAQGDADTMAEIDQAAEAFYEEHGSFILLRDWMILLLPDGWKLEPYRVSGYPIRRGSIQEIRLLPYSDPDDPEERHVRLICADRTEHFYLYQQQDLDALRIWMEEGGLAINE